MTQKVEKLQTQVVHDIERITPALAVAYLTDAAINRSLSETSVIKYRRAMEQGQWDLGQPLCFNAEGQLIDGQHRLHAVIQSGIAQDFNVLRGIEHAYHMDVGRARKPADILGMKGYKNASTLAAITRVVILMETRPGMTPIPTGSSSAYVTVDDIINRVESDPLLVQVAHDVAGKHKPLARMAKSSAVAGWFLYCLHHGLEDYEVADDFFSYLYGQMPGQPNNPAITLYKTLSSQHRSVRNLAKKERAAYIIKAWNAFIENRELSRIFFRSYGKKAEKFPTLVLDLAVITAIGVEE